MVMMVFLSLYTIVDGICISRFVGTDALSAANIVYPVLSLVIAVGVMLSTGGSAVIAKKIGKGRLPEARENFSFLILASFLLGVLFAVVGNLLIVPTVRLLGSTDLLLDYCLDYLSVLLWPPPPASCKFCSRAFLSPPENPPWACFSRSAAVWSTWCWTTPSWDR